MSKKVAPAKARKKTTKPAKHAELEMIPYEVTIGFGSFNVQAFVKACCAEDAEKKVLAIIKISAAPSKP